MKKLFILVTTLTGLFAVAANAFERAPLADAPSLANGETAAVSEYYNSEKTIQWQLTNSQLIQVGLNEYKLQCAYQGVRQPNPHSKPGITEIKFITTSAPKCPATPY